MDPAAIKPLTEAFAQSLSPNPVSRPCRSVQDQMLLRCGSPDLAALLCRHSSSKQKLFSKSSHGGQAMRY